MFNALPHLKSVASLCYMCSTAVLYLRLLPSTAPSLLSLHPSNDGGIIFLPLIASLLPLSPSNDCSYLISPYPRSLLLSLSLAHIIPPTPCLPPLCLLLLLLLVFGSCLFSLCICVSIRQTRVMLLYLPSFYPVVVSGLNVSSGWKSKYYDLCLYSNPIDMWQSHVFSFVSSRPLMLSFFCINQSFWR